MGRKKIEITYIKNTRIRRVTLKKRRIGLLKKAIQLSKLTGAKVMLRVYNSTDHSLVEYFSTSEDDFNGLNQNSPNVRKYKKYTNIDYESIDKTQ